MDEKVVEKLQIQTLLQQNLSIFITLTALMSFHIQRENIGLDYLLTLMQLWL